MHFSCRGHKRLSAVSVSRWNECHECKYEWWIFIKMYIVLLKCVTKKGEIIIKKVLYFKEMKVYVYISKSLITRGFYITRFPYKAKRKLKPSHYLVVFLPTKNTPSNWIEQFIYGCTYWICVVAVYGLFPIPIIKEFP